MFIVHYLVKDIFSTLFDGILSLLQISKSQK